MVVRRLCSSLLVLSFLLGCGGVHSYSVDLKRACFQPRNVVAIGWCEVGLTRCAVRNTISVVGIREREDNRTAHASSKLYTYVMITISINTSKIYSLCVIDGILFTYTNTRGCAWRVYLYYTYVCNMRLANYIILLFHSRWRRVNNISKFFNIIYHISRQNLVWKNIYILAIV